MRLRQAIRMVSASALVAVAAPTGAQADYYTPFTEFSAADNAQVGETADCQPGDVAIGGGVAVSGATYGDGVYLNTSRPEPVMNPMGGSWTVYIDNYLGGDASNDARAYAMCDSKGKPADYTLRSAGAVIPVNDGSSFGGIAECEPGEVAVGGGARAVDGVYADENYLQINSPWDDPGENKDKVPDDGWMVELNNDEGGAISNGLSVYAVCDEKNKQSKFDWLKETVKVKDGELKTAAAKCGRRPLVGGGVYGSGIYSEGLYVGQSFPRRLSGGKAQWTGSVHNYETPDDATRKFTVWAICKK